MKEIDVAKTIQDLLYKHQSVIIPGFGGFETNYKSASIDYVEGKISPPSRELGFNKDLTQKDDLLINYVQEVYDISRFEAEQVIDDFVIKLKESIEKQEIVTFPNVGRLYKDFQGEMKFLQDNINFNVESFGLPTVKFYPIQRQKIVGEGSASEDKKKTVPAAGASLIDNIANVFQRMMPLLISLSVIVVALGIYFIFIRDRVGGEDQKSQAVSVAADERLNIKPGQEEGEIFVDSEQQTDDIVDDKTPTSSDEEVEGDVEQIESEEAVDTEEATPDPNAKECIVIIGGFKNKENVEKLIANIYQEGFAAYSDSKGGLMRVGVQFAYTDQQELVDNFKEIREKFNSKAWILSQ